MKANKTIYRDVEVKEASASRARRRKWTAMPTATTMATMRATTTMSELLRGSEVPVDGLLLGVNWTFAEACYTNCVARPCATGECCE